MNATPVIQDINTVAAQTQEDSIDIAALMRQQSGVEQGLADDAKQAGEAAALVATTKGRGELDVQNAISKSASVLGGNILDTGSELITGLAQKVRETDLHSEQAFGEYRKQSETSFFDDPMAWMGANLLGGKEQARTRYNNAAIEYNNTKDRLAEVFVSTQQAAVTARANEKSVTDASIAAAATVARFQYDQVATQANYNVIGAQINARKELLAGNTAALNQRLEAWRVQLQSDNYKMEQQRLGIALSQFHDQEAGKKLWAAAYTAGMSLSNKPIPDGQAVERARLLYVSGAGKAELQSILDAGMSVITSNGQAPSFGSTPGAAAFNIARIQPRITDENPYKPVLGYLADRLANLPANINPTKDPAGAQRFIDDQTKVFAQQWATNAEGHGSLYADRGIKTTTDANAQLKGSTFYKAILDPLITSNVQSTTVAQMLHTAAAASAPGGQMTVEEAAKGVASYYDTVKTQNNINNFPGAVPPQKAYMAKPGGHMWENNMDASKYEQVVGKIIEIQRGLSIDQKINKQLTGSILAQ